MRSTADKKKWSLIHNDNGEWISEEHVIILTEKEAKVLPMEAVRQGFNLSVQHGPNGSLWCYKREYETIKYTNMNKEKLLETIKLKVKNNIIRFPSQIDLYVDGKTLIIRVNADGVCNNMQTDGAAFEGWAICLKSWLPETVCNVLLKWENQDSNLEGNKRLHYNRFLYRALRFSELYKWFSISETNLPEIEQFKIGLTNLRNNSFSENPRIKGIDKDKFRLSETVIEYLLANDLSSSIRERFDLDFIDRQFPVGVKKGNLPFFTGGMSAIDLWGTKNDTLTIIELKYNGGDSKNIKVGIISEIFMYACIMRDITKGMISRPDKTPNKHEEMLYDNHKKYKHIVARMLSDKYHPLLENEKVLSILNQQIIEEGDIVIEYNKTTYKLIEMI